MRRTIVSIALSAGMIHGAGADGIGVIAPLSGPSALLGQQMRAGAEIAAADLGVTLTVRDDACTAQGGEGAARDMVAAKVAAVTGFLCTEAIEAALPVLTTAGIPVVTPGVRTNSLTDRRKKTGWLVYRLGPRADDERAATAAILTRLWRDELFAIIDDGTIYGRELAESFRNAAEQNGLKPVFVDTFRPQLDNQVATVGRLRKAGATRVLVGGDREDIAILARDAAALGNGMIFAGGEGLRGAPGETPLAAGTIMIGLPEWSDGASPEVLSRFSERQVVPEGYALPAYAAVEVATQALEAALTSGRPVTETLAGHDFVTAIGTVRFDTDGNLGDNPYRAFVYDGTRFVPMEVP
ncbi:MAG: branched-chain amino acid ABC transporter substrate-binding protein [Rhizobiaceae bacterium]|nr:branched-chain amino acid ABC transporter substrate-binding protein [Rhizobiaceae bacterium]